MKIHKPNKKAINKRKTRIRSKIRGTAEMPRLSIFRSNKNIYAQLIDDVKGNTLESYSSMKIKDGQTKQDEAYKVGQELAKKALKKIKKEL